MDCNLSTLGFNVVPVDLSFLLTIGKVTRLSGVVNSDFQGLTLPDNIFNGPGELGVDPLRHLAT